MTLSFAQALPDRGAPSNRLITLVGLFWAFTYVLLSIRGAIFHDDWSRLIDNNRLMAVTVGAAAYAMVLRQLASGHRVTLKGAIAWIAGATLAVMIVRVTLDELMFDVPQGVGINLLWSLTWSAYFGLWVMGSLAFAPVASAKNAVGQAGITVTPGDPESLELLIEAIFAESSTLKKTDRARLAAKVLELGGYESAEGSARDNERARLAIRLAARLSS